MDWLSDERCYICGNCVDRRTKTIFVCGIPLNARAIVREPRG